MIKADQHSPDLLLSLDGAGPKALRSRLERELREAIRAGRLHPGTSLPSTRALARELDVSRGVVVEAYSQLAAEGYLSARQGAATRVAPVASAGSAEPQPDEPEPPAVRYDLRPSVPDLTAFPRREWLASMRRVLSAAPGATFDYPERLGAPALRAALAAYLGRARGVVAGPDGTLVSSGTLQSLGLIAGVLVARARRRIAVEHPGFWIHRILLRRCGIEVLRVPVDERGIDVDALAATGADAVLVTPAHQMPLGAVLAPERRAALVEWARRTDALVIEDDFCGEFRYDREPVGALQGLAPERVAYLGSASKTLAPSLRLGWAVLPDWLVEEVADAKAWADGGTPALSQLTLADFIEQGELDRHLRRVRLRYRRRRDLLVAGMGRLLPELRIGGVAAGLHAVAHPPEPIDEAELVERAAERGIALAAFRAAGRSLLMLGYANLPEPSVEPALRELRAALREV